MAQESLHCSDVLCTNTEHSKERDHHVIGVINSVIESTFLLQPVKKVVHGAPKKKTLLLPGWVEYVKPLKDDSIFWHSVWVSAGRPTAGGLFSVMKWTKNEFHYAVRRLKNEANIAKSQSLRLSAMSGTTAFLKSVKDILK